MMNTATYDTSIQPLDALWALFINQPKAVKRAFTERILAADIEARGLRNRLAVKQSLKQAFAELENARVSGMQLPNARDLFK